MDCIHCNVKEKINKEIDIKQISLTLMYGKIHKNKMQR